MCKKILIIDDSATIRKRIQYELSQTGTKCVEVSNMSDLLQLGSMQFDIVILDLEMTLPGEKIGEWLKKHYPQARVIIFSGATLARLNIACENIQACAAISKTDSNAYQNLLKCVGCENNMKTCEHPH